MIKNIDQVTKDLRELADAINAFKSEAVQLRLVELLLGEIEEPDEAPAAGRSGRAKPRRSKKPKIVTPAPPAADAKIPAPKQPKAGSSMGGRAVLSRLLSEGYFKKPRTIRDLLEHSSSNLALRLTPQDFSGRLARFVRDGKLKRDKNADGQYQYTEP